MNADVDIRIAMWSGPRNISTALMRAWDARPDTVVTDEPLYAPYLLATELDHPGRAEIIAHHETDWRAVVRRLAGSVPGGASVFYQKHMAHHLLPDMDIGWIDRVSNCFLVREPREMVASLSKVIPNPTLEQTGLPQQVALFDRVRRTTGAVPPVIDARDVLTDPAGVLEALCRRLGVPWTDTMLRWPAGPRPTDGIWAKHWYDAVERSTGFAPCRPRDVDLPAGLSDLAGRCDELYRCLYEHRITSGEDDAPDVRRT
ncbi:MAG: sulfotransferase [Planctomycetes bacterium]|nr:sulfotransferase [Planctomycetota bacterium]